MTRARWILAALLVYAAWHQWSSRSQYQPDGVLAGAMPVQHDLSGNRSFDLNGYKVTPLADFDLQARVLSRTDYYVGREADLSPTDLALGWGRMSDSAVLQKINISQGGRWYHWQTDDPPIPLREIEISSANMHMIPANDDVTRVLKTVRQGQMVSLTGKLIRVDASDGWHWQSSLTREDTGDGACELVYVEHINITR